MLKQHMLCRVTNRYCLRNFSLLKQLLVSRLWLKHSMEVQTSSQHSACVVPLFLSSYLHQNFIIGRFCFLCGFHPCNITDWKKTFYTKPGKAGKNWNGMSSLQQSFLAWLQAHEAWAFSNDQNTCAVLRLAHLRLKNTCNFLKCSSFIFARHKYCFYPSKYYKFCNWQISS